MKNNEGLSQSLVLSDRLNSPKGLSRGNRLGDSDEAQTEEKNIKAVSPGKSHPITITYASPHEIKTSPPLIINEKSPVTQKGTSLTPNVEE